ncbi:MAG: cardiolipin synthase [Muribaculaceae bacterium]
MFDVLTDILSYQWLYNTLLIIYAVTTISTIGVVLSENRNPVKSLAWVTVLMLLPVVGLVLYLFFGRNIRNTRKISRRSRRRLKRREAIPVVDFSSLDLSEASLQQIRLGRNLTRMPFYPGNDVKIYTSGAEKFADLQRDLAAAQHYINIQYYIIEDDHIGRRIRDILVAKAAEGVCVRMIYDHVGSFRVAGKFFRDMRKAGIQAHPFFKVSFPLLGTRINWRNHRKLCVIDGQVGYLGGMNIADRYIDGGKRFKSWRDTHVRVTGPIVNALRHSFAIDWRFMGLPLVEDTPYPADTLPGNVGAQLIISGPTSQWSGLEMSFHKAIANAKRRIYIQTPYFLPTDGLLKALQTAALANVDTRIMVPRHSDSAMLTYATQSYIAQCLDAGIKIYFYNDGMLHAKTIIVDDDICTIGSTNFDFRSFEHNFESNLFFYSRGINEQMASIFHDDMMHCTRVHQSEWRKRPITQKATESILRLLSPIL